MLDLQRAARARDSRTGSSSSSSVKPCQVKLKRPAGLLNENAMTIAIGRKR